MFLFVLLKPFGWLLGALDYSFVFLNTLLGRSGPKFFRQGAGNLQRPYDAQDNMLRDLSDKGKLSTSIHLAEKDIRWDDKASDTKKHCTVENGQFISPAADILPEASKLCSFYRVRPVEEAQSPRSQDDVVVIMLPATGEMGKSVRLNMAQQLAKDHGWSSILVTAPYYGARMPSGQNLFFLNTVGDMLAQSQGIVQETAALIGYFLERSPNTKVCVTGFSWGGAMSSSAVAVSLLGGADGRRIALVPYVGCHSPISFADGVLESSLDWNSLRRTQDEAREQTRQAWAETFLQTQLKVITEYLDKASDRHRVAVVRSVCMDHDLFIRVKYSEEFLKQLQGLHPHTFSNQWIPGGHGFGMLVRPWVQKNEIVTAICDLEKLQ